MEFSSMEELKKHVMPALKIRVKELKNNGYNYDVDSLWNYLSNIWRNSNNLTLAELVDDILNHAVDEK